MSNRKIADSIIIRVGQGIVSVPRNIKSEPVQPTAQIVVKDKKPADESPVLPKSTANP